MIGITSIGAYVPVWRLNRSAIAKHFRGEKAVANFDEDSITMAVAASMSALDGTERKEIGGLFFASTTSPYIEKQASTLVAAAVDLPREIRTADFCHSLRGGTTAINAAIDTVKAGSAKKVMVTASDTRPGKPGSAFEQNFGDGAASLVIGDTDVAVSVEASHSVSNELLDIWRGQDEQFVRSWETRFFITQGYLKIVRETVAGLLKKTGLAPNDFSKVVLYSPDGRSVVGLATSLGFDPKTQLQDILFDAMGNTGTAYSMQLLVAALEDAKAGDRILWASYGNGSDAFVLQVTENVEKLRNRNVMSKLLASKKSVPDYVTYLRWRGFLDTTPLHTRPTPVASATTLMQERSAIIPFLGAKCKNCGTVQHPPQRICTKCQTMDQFEEVRLSDKKGTLFSYSLDMVTSQVDVPLVYSVVNFEGGGRVITTITDKEPQDIKSGMELEMTFRKLFASEGYTNYFWKAMPLR